MRHITQLGRTIGSHWAPISHISRIQGRKYIKSCKFAIAAFFADNLIQMHPISRGAKLVAPFSGSAFSPAAALFKATHAGVSAPIVSLGKALLAAQRPFVVAFSVPRPSEHSSKHSNIPDLLGWLRDLVFQVQKEEGRQGKKRCRGKRGGGEILDLAQH